MPKAQVLVILGPTASGKSAVAVVLAKKYNGEVISADSRQVYRGLDIGSGKVTKREMAGVPHHLLDVASPRRVFTIAQYQKLAQKKVREIIRRGKLPIICGGTGFYIQAIVDGIALPEVKPNLTLRKKLEQKSAPELFKTLQKLDPARAKNIDANNPRRLIRAIEIATALGRVPVLQKQTENEYDFIQIGIKTDPTELRERLRRRLAKRLKHGLIEEVKKLKESGLSWARLDALGLEYRYVSRYLRGEMRRDEMVQKLETEIWHYAKRQQTWWKGDDRIQWLDRRSASKLSLSRGSRGTSNLSPNPGDRSA